jgi:hypothetical protein
MAYSNEYWYFQDVNYDLLLEKYAYHYPVLVKGDYGLYSENFHIEIESDAKQ